MRDWTVAVGHRPLHRRGTPSSRSSPITWPRPRPRPPSLPGRGLGRPAVRRRRLAARSPSGPAGPRSGRRSCPSRCAPRSPRPGASWSRTSRVSAVVLASRWSSTGTARSTCMSQLHTEPRRGHPADRTLRPGDAERRRSSAGPTCSAPASPSGTHTLVSPTARRARAAADVPAAGRAARRAARPPALARRAAGGAGRSSRRWPRRCCAAPTPTLRLGRAAPARLRRRRRSAAVAVRGCWSRCPAARSGPGRMADVGAVRCSTCSCTRHRALGVGGLLGGWSPPPGAARRALSATGRLSPGRPCRRSRLARADPRPRALVVLVSGAGTNLQALLDACRRPGVRRRGGRRRRRPRRHRGAGPGRAGRRPDVRAPGQGLRDAATAWDAALTDVRAPAYEPDLVVSAGFMKLVGAGFLAAFGGRFVNTHPALLAVVPRHARAGRRAGVRREGHRLHAVRRRRRRRHRPDRRAGRRAGARTTTPSRRCTSGSRSPSGAMLVDASAGWPARASPSTADGAVRRAEPGRRLAAHDWRRWATTGE